jgi:uncharacterized protein YecT (DUF1311 family)
VEKRHWQPLADSVICASGIGKYSMRAIGLAVVIAAIATTAVAAPGTAKVDDIRSRYTKAYNDCPGFKSGVTPEMLDCISAEYDIQDKRLNTAFAGAMRGLSPHRQASLRAAQRTWIAYRDAWCGVIYDNDSGQAEHVASNQCMLDETIRQTIKLDELARYAAAG